MDRDKWQCPHYSTSLRIPMLRAHPNNGICLALGIGNDIHQLVHASNNNKESDQSVR